MRFSEVYSTTKLGNSEACHDVTICDSFNRFYTELRGLKYKLMLSMKTIGLYGASCVVWLKSCVCLKGKFGLFVGNSCMICMVQTFCDSTLL